MITTTAATTGPLFERGLAQRLLAANLRAATDAAPKLGEALAAAYAGHRGPGRYGHLSASIRHVVQVAGNTVAVRAFPAGKPAFKAVFLERGTRGPHRGGRSGIVLPREKRDRQARLAGHAAALKIGPLFRRSAQPHGAPAFHVAERTLEAQWPGLQLMFQRALAAEVGAA